MDPADQMAAQLGFVWAEELFQRLSQSELVDCPARWPGRMDHARGLARSIPSAPTDAGAQERLAKIVNRSAEAFWDVLVSGR